MSLVDATCEFVGGKSLTAVAIWKKDIYCTRRSSVQRDGMDQTNSKIPSPLIHEKGPIGSCVIRSFKSVNK